MAKQLVSEGLWQAKEPLLPVEDEKLKGGRPRISNRATLAGILFVLKTGIPWEMLSQEMGCGSGMTCWRRLRDWQQAGVGIGCIGCCWNICRKLNNWIGHELH
jgi:transposase